MAKKPITITLLMQELTYDISNETYLRGRTLLTDDNYAQTAHMYASLDEDNRDRIMRSVKAAFSRLKAEAAEYLDEKAVAADNGQISEGADLELRLMMPANFNEAATAAATESCHDYIVKSAVADWYLLTNSEEAAAYAALAAGALDNLHTQLSKRSRPTRETIGKQLQNG